MSIATRTEFRYFLKKCVQVAKTKFLTNFVALVLLTEFFDPFDSVVP